MTTVAQLRKAALALPEVEEGSHFGMVSFAVRGKGFASVTKDGRVQLQMSDEDAEAFLVDRPTGERLARNGTPIGVSVPLADVNGQQLNALVRASWFSRAPKRLAASLEAAESSADGQVGDLPKSIGRPATQALAEAGLTTLDHVATRTEAELLALHGVGPKAVRVLADVLDARGASLRTSSGDGQ